MKINGYRDMKRNVQYRIGENLEENNLNNIQKFIESAFLVLLLLGLFVGDGSAAASTYPPLPTSYWGYVTNNSIPEANALITVYDSSGNLVANATSNQDKLYQVTVPRYDATTSPGGVADCTIITFKVDGTTAISRYIDSQGTNNRLDLSILPASNTPITVPSSCVGSSSSSSSSGGGGGGGGSGVSGENYTNIQAQESRDESIAKDLPASYNFTSVELPVYGIVITGNTNAGIIGAKIELLKDTSTLVKEVPFGTVYKNVNVWVGTAGFATPKNIKEAIIKFKVENSWIASGGFKDTEIVMLRWDGTQWVRLETQPKYNDGGFTHYEAKTNAFSPFAIVGLKGGVVPTSAGAIATGAPVTTTTAITTPPARTPAIPAAVTMIVIIAAAICFSMLQKGGRNK